MIDAFRYAVGTLTAIPVPPPRSTGRRVAGPAMALAPVATIPLGVLVGLICWGGREAGLAPLAVAATAIGALALGSRALHLDGLADTADGLTASYDRERALAVMRTGDVGPAGAAAVVIVLGIQIGSIASLLTAELGPLLIGIAVVVSRGILVLACTHRIRPARRDGLARGPARSVPTHITVAVLAMMTILTCAAAQTIDLPWWRGAIAWAAAVIVAGALLRRCVTRLGGVTGDVFGACIELALAALLLALT